MNVQRKKREGIECITLISFNKTDIVCCNEGGKDAVEKVRLCKVQRENA